MNPIIIANWKCNPQTREEAAALLNDVERGVKDLAGVDVVICPPFVYTSLVKDYPGLIAGGQDVFWERGGAFTGEISPDMLADQGCRYVILGHSERRSFSRETDEIVKKKVEAALSAGITPVVCVGETREEREAGETYKVLEREVALLRDYAGDLIFAYEPLWAISTSRAGGACSPEEAREVREWILNAYPVTACLYGGSVTSRNARAFMDEAGFRGVLVGGASLNAAELVSLVRSVVDSNDGHR